MRNPRLSRTLALTIVATGLVAAPAGFLLPAAVAGDTLRTILVTYGLSAVLFGGFAALFRHRDVRAQARLARGEGIVARWHVDAETWRAFVADDRQRGRQAGELPNELLLGDDVPPTGVEVIVGESAAQIDESVHPLPRRGTPEVTHAQLNKGRVRPSFVELQLFYPEGGYGASGIPRDSTRTALRFPVPWAALPDAERVVAYYASGRPASRTSSTAPGRPRPPRSPARATSRPASPPRRCPRSAYTPSPLPGGERGSEGLPQPGARRGACRLRARSFDV